MNDVLASLVGRRGDVLDVAWADMRALGAYDRLGAFEADDVVAAMEWTFSAFLQCLADGRRFTVLELEQLEETGVQRARQGIPLETVSRGFRIGLRRSYEQLVRLVFERLDGSTASVLGELSVAVLDLAMDAWEAIARGYVQEGEHRLSMQSRVKRGLVEAVLDGSMTGHDLEARARELCLEARTQWVLVVAVPFKDPARRLHAVPDALMAIVPGAMEGPVRSLPVPHSVIIASGWQDSHTMTDKLTAVALDHDVALVVAPASALSELGRRYRRLRPHMHLVPQVAEGARVMPISDLAIYELVGSTPLETAKAFVHDTLGAVLALPRARGDVLLDTVEALYATGGHVRTAAERLQVHHRSVRHRIDTLKAFTGLNLLDAADLMTATLGAHLLRLHRQHLPPPGDAAWHLDEQRNSSSLR